MVFTTYNGMVAISKKLNLNKKVSDVLEILSTLNSLRSDRSLNKRKQYDLTKTFKSIFGMAALPFLCRDPFLPKYHSIKM